MSREREVTITWNYYADDTGELSSGSLIHVPISFCRKEVDAMKAQGKLVQVFDPLTGDEIPDTEY